MTLRERWRRLDERRRAAVGVPPTLQPTVAATLADHHRAGEGWLVAFARDYDVDVDELLAVACEIDAITTPNIAALAAIGAVGRAEALSAAHGGGFVCGFFLGLDLGRDGRT